MRLVTPRLTLAEYGKGSSVFANRVLGEFADDADESLVSRQWLGQAAARWAEAEPPDRLPQSVVCGLDVARYGVDESVLAIRHGRRLVEFITWTKSSTVESAGRVFRTAQYTAARAAETPHVVE